MCDCVRVARLLLYACSCLLYLLVFIILGNCCCRFVFVVVDAVVVVCYPHPHSHTHTRLLQLGICINMTHYTYHKHITRPTGRHNDFHINLCTDPRQSQFLRLPLSCQCNGVWCMICCTSTRTPKYEHIISQTHHKLTKQSINIGGLLVSA